MRLWRLSKPVRASWSRMEDKPFHELGALNNDNHPTQIISGLIFCNNLEGVWVVFSPPPLPPPSFPFSTPPHPSLPSPICIYYLPCLPFLSPYSFFLNLPHVFLFFPYQTPSPLKKISTNRRPHLFPSLSFPPIERPGVLIINLNNLHGFKHTKK